MTDTDFGAVWLWRLVLAAALVVALALGRARPTLALVVGAALLLASLGLVDHAAMQTGRARRAPSRQRRVASAGDGGVVGRPADVRALPQGLSRPEPERGRG